MDAVKPDSLKNKLLAGKGDAWLSKSLVILKDDLPLETQMKPFSDEPPSPELNAWFHSLEFHSLARTESKQTAQVAATHWLPVQTGVADVPSQSVETEQPQTPDADKQSGVVPAHVVTLSQPVRFALQTC